jgi:hypothetical protein
MIVARSPGLNSIVTSGDASRGATGTGPADDDEPPAKCCTDSTVMAPAAKPRRSTRSSFTAEVRTEYRSGPPDGIAVRADPLA